MTAGWIITVVAGLVGTPLLLVAPSLISDYFAKKRGEM